ncbi:mCG141057 [Mus musculus]|nr:mCG141057 [Mus musculus]
MHKAHVSSKQTKSQHEETPYPQDFNRGIKFDEWHRGCKRG